MLMAGAHPVFFMHYCGEKISSVSLTSENINPCCCENAVAMSHAGHAGTESSSVTQSHTSCCHIQKVPVSTDDYQQQTQLNISTVLPAFDSTWITLHHLSGHIEPDNTRTIRHLFPPGGLNRQGIDLLASICIYRI
jgi:hypothetical protein